MNSVNLVGVLVDAPVSRQSSTGQTECAMRLAVPRIGPSGVREPGVVFVEIVTGGLRAQDLLEEAAGGMRVAVSGRLELDEWTDDDGVRHTRYEVLADQLELIDAPEPGGEAAA